MTKLTYLIDGEMILKYQVLSEDLDALISVKSDEDLCHMFEEIDRYESAGSPRMRAFLFPVNPIVMENQIGSAEPHAVEQRYIDSINGIIRTTPLSVKQHPTISTMQHGSLVSSACSSPRSPDSSTTEVINSEFHSRGVSMHKVRSSPNICGLNIPPHGNHHLHQLPFQYHQRQAQLPGHLSPRPRTDSYKNGAPERLISVRSVGRADGIRYQVDPGPQYNYASRQIRGCAKCMHNDDDCIHISDRRIGDKTGSFTTSPVPSSPRYIHGGIKIWDSMINGSMRAN
ncbi:UNVERIFIED_CONTAM: hypothetical protein Sradi_4740500 [Sesamum radiatum]|uniref:PB1 domain-containing protein n=1 Tax=Sesamum radiatum TaxID=300843 RepID=A0AAW2MXP5_SESRA